MGQIQPITRNHDFWYIKANIQNSNIKDLEESDSDEEGVDADRTRTMEFDITKAEDLKAWVDAEGGHIRSRIQTDANTGHLFYVDEQRSGFLFIPHGDFDKICFISLYKPGNKSIGFTGEKLIRAARVYITLHTTFKDAIKETKVERLQHYMKANYNTSDLNDDEIKEHAIQIMDILERCKEDDDLTTKDRDVLLAFFDENEDFSTELTEMHAAVKSHSIVINPWFNSVRMYSRGDGPRKLHTGKKLDIDDQVWNAAFKWISPDSGQQPQGEKAFNDSSINAHAALGRNMMGGSSS